MCEGVRKRAIMIREARETCKSKATRSRLIAWALTVAGRIDAEHCRDVDAVDYLLKPFEEERFTLAITRALGRLGHPDHLISSDGWRGVVQEIRARPGRVLSTDIRNSPLFDISDSPPPRVTPRSRPSGRGGVARPGVSPSSDRTRL